MEREEIEAIIKQNPLGYQGYSLLGDYLLSANSRQAFLCYENALYYCDNADEAGKLQKKISELIDKKQNVPKAAMVILSYNNREYTQNCIESIRETTPTSSREIIIVDNNSSDDSVAYLREQTDILLRENKENAGFPGGCNQGIRMAQADSDIFLLNNDTILCANTLFWLRMGLYEEEYYGSAVSCTNHSANLQQTVQDELSIDEYRKIALSTNVPGEKKKVLEPRIAMNAYAMLIKREVLEKTGYLDEIFSPGNFEDDDLCLRILRAGYQNVFVRNSFIVHLGSKSFGIRPDLWELLRKNKVKFEHKYGMNTYEQTRPDFEAADLIRTFSLEAGKKCLLINCGFGATLLHLKYDYPDVEFYGCTKDVCAAAIGKQLRNVVVEPYFSADSLPFEGVKFDYIAINLNPITNEEFERYAEGIKKCLKDDGKLFVNIYNHRYFENWITQLQHGQSYESLCKNKFMFSTVFSEFERLGFRGNMTMLKYSWPNVNSIEKAFVDQMSNALDESIKNVIYMKCYAIAFTKI